MKEAVPVAVLNVSDRPSLYSTVVMPSPRQAITVTPDCRA
jgi:hypothetical protein